MPHFKDEPMQGRNMQMSHLWLLDDECLTEITMNMNRFDSNLSQELFKDSKGHWFSFVHCLKDLISIATCPDLEYNFLKDNTKNTILYTEPNVLIQQGSFRGIYLDFIADSDKVVYNMRRAFGSEFYSSAKKMFREKYNEIDKEKAPYIILNDPKRRRYKVVYDNLIKMAESATKYLTGRSWLQKVTYHGIYNGEEVFFILRNDLHQYNQYTIQLYTEDPFFNNWYNLKEKL